jgi:hypothetical protein
MPSTPIQNLADATQPPPVESVETRFRRLEAEWNADTEYLSNVSKIMGHPAFHSIIALGDDVVPFMLRDMESGPSLWVWALPKITGANPVSPQDAGNIRKMTEVWLEWARQKGLR